MTPEERLWFAVLKQAALDATKNVVFKEPVQRFNETREKYKQRLYDARYDHQVALHEKENAIKFFSRRQFRIICDALDLDTKRVIDIFKKQGIDLSKARELNDFHKILQEAA